MLQQTLLGFDILLELIMKVFTHTNDKLVSTALLVLRIALGAIMFAHGAQKVLGVWGGMGLDATVKGMSGMLGIPPFMVYLSAYTEFLGGLGILFGVLTRFFGVTVLINMLVAILAVHLKNGFFAPTGFEYPFSLALSALAITIAGPGAFSLDNLMFGGRQSESKITVRTSHIGVGPTAKPAI